MSYPEELLPKSNYKIIDVANIQDASLIRKSLKDKKSSFDNIGDLKIIAICEKDYDVFGLSANLFAIYDCKHLNYNPCDKAFYSYWYPNESVPSKDDIKFVLLKNVFPIYFPIKELHNQIYPYKKTLPKNNELIEFAGITYIVHKPTKCNFWHFEYIICDESQNAIVKDKKKWKKRIASFLIKSFLKEFAFFKKPKKFKLDNSIYKLR